MKGAAQGPAGGGRHSLPATAIRGTPPPPPDRRRARLFQAVCRSAQRPTLAGPVPHDSPHTRARRTGGAGSGTCETSRPRPPRKHTPHTEGERERESEGGRERISSRGRRLSACARPSERKHGPRAPAWSAQLHRRPTASSSRACAASQGTAASNGHSDEPRAPDQGNQSAKHRPTGPPWTRMQAGAGALEAAQPSRSTGTPGTTGNAATGGGQRAAGAASIDRCCPTRARPPAAALRDSLWRARAWDTEEGGTARSGYKPQDGTRKQREGGGRCGGSRGRRRRVQPHTYARKEGRGCVAGEVHGATAREGGAGGGRGRLWAEPIGTGHGRRATPAAPGPDPTTPTACVRKFRAAERAKSSRQDTGVWGTKSHWSAKRCDGIPASTQTARDGAAALRTPTHKRLARGGPRPTCATRPRMGTTLQKEDGRKASELLYPPRWSCPKQACSHPAGFRCITQRRTDCCQAVAPPRTWWREQLLFGAVRSTSLHPLLPRGIPRARPSQAPSLVHRLGPLLAANAKATRAHPPHAETMPLRGGPGAPRRAAVRGAPISQRCTHDEGGVFGASGPRDPPHRTRTRALSLPTGNRRRQRRRPHGQLPRAIYACGERWRFGWARCAERSRAQEALRKRASARSCQGRSGAHRLEKKEREGGQTRARRCPRLRAQPGECTRLRDQDPVPT